MNYYQYKRRAPRRSGADYIKPFLVIAIFIAILYAGWNLLSTLLIGDVQNLTNESVNLEIESGSAKAMTESDSTWKNVPSSIDLYEGEAVKTLSDGRLTLGFFEGTIVRLDRSSELSLDILRKEAEQGNLGLTLSEGKLWVNMAKNNASTLSLNTDLLRLTTTDGIFAISYPGTLYVVSGSVQAKIMHEDTAIKTVEVGVGQQLLIDESIVADLAEDLTKDILFALDDSFKTSNWYRWNRQKDGLEALEPTEDLMEADDAIEDASTETEDEEVVDDEEEQEPEAEPVEEIVTEEEEEDLSDDTVAPTTPQLSTPGSNGETVELDDIVQEITGTVSDDTYVVIVNDYRLTQYRPGDGEFAYRANVAFDNLEVGDNEYIVIAQDKAGNQSESASITLTLSQEVYDEKMAELKEEEGAEEVSTQETPAAASEGGVSFTAPNGGENLVTSEHSFELTGDVPAGTTKVTVNNYQLQGFAEGDTSFLYRANSTLKTLEIGALNTYTARAYDAEGSLLGSATMTIDVESGSNGESAPVINMPSADGSYSTTLNEVVLGGTVGKWITRVRIDGVNVTEYIPGSEEWKKTVTLEPGENIFEVCSEQAGEPKGCSSITIEYQN